MSQSELEAEKFNWWKLSPQTLEIKKSSSISLSDSLIVAKFPTI